MRNGSWDEARTSAHRPQRSELSEFVRGRVHAPVSDLGDSFSSLDASGQGQVRESESRHGGLTVPAAIFPPRSLSRSISSHDGAGSISRVMDDFMCRGVCVMSHDTSWTRDRRELIATPAGCDRPRVRRLSNKLAAVSRHARGIWLFLAARAAAEHTLPFASSTGTWRVCSTNACSFRVIAIGIKFAPCFTACFTRKSESLAKGKLFVET